MKRKTWAAAGAGAVVALGAACWMLADGDTRQAIGPNAVALASGGEPHAPLQESASLQRMGAATYSAPVPRPDLALTDEASAAYELVNANLRCQIDRDAPSGDHIKLSTDPQLCDDFKKKPLSRSEIYQAITQAAEHGDVRAQLHYAGYAAELFDDPKYALDPNSVREFKLNTVKFLKAAGRNGESDAYLRLSDIYKEGTVTESDPALSYAYANAFFQTSKRRYAGNILRQSRAGLNQEELRRGEQMTREIINQRNDI